VTSKSLNIYSR